MFYLLTDNKMSGNYKGIRIGISDTGNVYLKRLADRVMLKRYTPLDYDYMQDYIDDRNDTLTEWRDEVYSGYTERSYEERMEDYNYEYSDYFQYDDEMEEYYDGDEGDMTWDYIDAGNFDTKETFIDAVIDKFDDYYYDSSYEWTNDMADLNQLRQKIGEYYDECIAYKKEQEESRKPHWNVFNYYK